MTFIILKKRYKSLIRKAFTKKYSFLNIPFNYSEPFLPRLKMSNNPKPFDPVQIITYEQDARDFV